MIGIIDYKAGNLTSVARAIQYLGFKWMISSDPEKLRKCERIIFPGVGAARSAMESLREFHLDEFLKEAFKKGIPIFGICLGTQIVMEESEEDGGTKTLGLIPGKVHRFPDPLIWNNEVLKVPHMGWNSVQWLRKHPVINGLDPDFEYYFVHSYYPKPAKEDFILGYTFYGINFPSAIIYENLIAFQFHPEKSGRPGLLILKNFCEWKP
ncbi:MAG: imidazole glycerol phosphate synthase subunit HisH [Caldimicrobium thiodismutans]|jgi:glutamine amidotransferase|uniref:Imidazole glycerol phosphate synthase subunit HisH n=1 Tax=Caldimicrobium thiodismutans TaxID=1653476 RepID=A0A2N7PIY7_9BACT|nr:MAG: imidazole glycerol phosphate synthase subunit HisH [Caldimicrobium thiodismutans]